MIKPNRKASSAETALPVSIARARLRSNLARQASATVAGTTSSFVSGKLNCALAEAILQVTRERQLATITGGDSIDGGDHRHATVFDLTEERLAAFGNFESAIRSRLVHVMSVPAQKASSPVPVRMTARRLGSAVEVCEDVAEGENHLPRKRVEFFRAVEANDYNMNHVARW